MFLFKTVKDLHNFVTLYREKGNTIGFVPTMGALHEGHLSLIRQAKKTCDYTVCSIFVNPTQFNDAADLDKYPRTITADTDLLTSVKTDVLFLPAVEEVYPPDLDTKLTLDFGQLDQVMEGAFRPGHFEGMAQVVKRLLDIVQPDQLFMGQKDFQQLTIVRSMLQQLAMPIELVMCPIIREKDGLAMSSRNRRLPAADRQSATLISQTLSEVANQINEKTPTVLIKEAMETLHIPAFKPEYFAIVDGYTLQAVEDFRESDFVVACTAVWVGEVRLIDNKILKQPK